MYIIYASKIRENAQQLHYLCDNQIEQRIVANGLKMVVH